MRFICSRIVHAMLLLALLDRLVRYVAIARFFRRVPPAPPAAVLPLVSILQPILSGDPTLAASLEEILCARSAHPREWLWLLDDDDAAGQAICTELCARYPAAMIRVIRCAPAPPDHNPKLAKLIVGLEAAQGAVICVLDDDTRLPDGGLDQLVAALGAPGAGLAFGLPYYVCYANLWSALTALFVNGNSLPTYVPAALLGEPTTINGMCYAIRRAVLDQVGGLRGLERFVADDFAVAQRMRAHGLRLVQTPVRHAISTYVAGPGHYWRLIQRWLIFPRESLMRRLGPADTLRFYAVAVLPLTAPWLAVGAAVRGRPAVRRLGVAYLLLNWIGPLWLSRRYLNNAIPLRWAWLLPVAQLLLPAQAVAALLAPQRIVWRGHVIAVEPGGTVRMVKRRTVRSSQSDSSQFRR
jgi:ceramide glucosyltransferase